LKTVRSRASRGCARGTKRPTSANGSQGITPTWTPRFSAGTTLWLDPAFRDWNIEKYLPAITCPVLVLQGEDDEYGTRRQVDAIAAQAGGPVETELLPQSAPRRESVDLAPPSATQH
jgi:pimeloyl-ACP methyl ester carboxylesterase